MDISKVGENIRALCTTRQITFPKLADITGISCLTIMSHIKGKTSMDMKTLGLYCEALGCEPNDLLKGSLDPEVFRLDDNILERYPWNIIVALNGGYNRHNPESVKEMKQIVYRAYAPGLEACMAELPERQQAILRYRFQNGLTLDKVGEILGVTRGRVRQLEKKALWTLRIPRFQQAWQFDTMSAAGKIAAERDAVRLENTALKAKVAYLCEQQQTSEADFEAEMQKLAMEAIERENNAPIEDLELSVRSFNCLVQNGIHTIGDLKAKTPDDLRHIRNLGPISFREIIKCIEDRGIQLKSA